MTTGYNIACALLPSLVSIPFYAIPISLSIIHRNFYLLVYKNPLALHTGANLEASTYQCRQIFSQYTPVYVHVYIHVALHPYDTQIHVHVHTCM